jgi:hypothetical protein
MDFFQRIKNDPLFSLYDYDKLLLKLDFDVNNIHKYIGYNAYNIDYSTSYLIDKNKKKTQLNLLLIQNNDIVKIGCMKDYIIIKKNENEICVYKKNNNIITTFIDNFLNIFKIDRFLTCVFCVKNNDLYNLLRCKKRYNYFYEEFP